MRPLDPPARRALTALAVLAAVGAIQVTFLIGVEADRTLRHRGAIQALQSEVATLRVEADELRAVADRAGDAVYREQLARRQGFVREGETRLIVVRPDAP